MILAPNLISHLAGFRNRAQKQPNQNPNQRQNKKQFQKSERMAPFHWNAFHIFILIKIVKCYVPLRLGWQIPLPKTGLRHTP